MLTGFEDHIYFKVSFEGRRTIDYSFAAVTTEIQDDG